MSGLEIASAVWIALALVLWGGALWSMRQPGFRVRWLRDAMIWTCVIVGMALLYVALWPYLPPGFGLR